MKKLLIITAAFVCFTAFPAFAVDEGEIYQCGAPKEAHVAPGPFTYCNIHDRRFAYKEKAQMLRDDILARQKNYNEPRKRALAEYKAKEQALHGY